MADSVILRTQDVEINHPKQGKRVMDVFIDTSRRQAIEQIEQVTQENMDLIEQKGEQTKASIPSEYSKLQEDVSQLSESIVENYSELKGDLANLTNDIQTEILENSYFVRTGSIATSNFYYIKRLDVENLTNIQIITYGYYAGPVTTAMVDEYGKVIEKASNTNVDDGEHSYIFTVTDDAKYIYISCENGKNTKYFVYGLPSLLSSFETKANHDSDINELHNKIERVVNKPTYTNIVGQYYSRTGGGEIVDSSDLNTLTKIDVEGFAGCYIYVASYYLDPMMQAICDKDGKQLWISERVSSEGLHSNKIEIPLGAKWFYLSNKTSNIEQMFYEIVDINSSISNIINEVYKPTIPDFISCFLKIGVIGDSLASGEAISNETETRVGRDMYEHSWIQHLARSSGVEAVNFSKGGATCKSWLSNSEYGLGKLQDVNNKCNAYFIGLGENDVNPSENWDSYKGSYDDIVTYANTYYGNYSNIIHQIKLIQPKAKIFCITMPNISASTRRTEANNIIKDIVEYYDNCYVIDLENDDLYKNGIVRESEKQRVNHYNSIAYKIMADHIKEIVNKFIYDNYTEFMQLEFIGTDYSWNE